MNSSRMIRILIVVLVVGMVAGALGLSEADDVRVTEPCSTEERASLESFSFEDLDRLLSRYVDENGRVDYAAWKANVGDRESLHAYLRRAGCVDLSQPASREARLAFWINLYNSLTIEGILREYPTASIREHTGRVGFNIWKDLLVFVDTEYFSLEQIEHAVLRKMDEPRIHFAIVCASIGCPKLRNEAYVGSRLDRQLSDNARHFFRQPRNFRIEGRTVHLSKILEWFGEDFGSNLTERRTAIERYLPDAASRDAIRRKEMKIRYLAYDWRLNDQRSDPSRIR